jgi:uncharacterized RDD family membrane protein YckC
MDQRPPEGTDPPEPPATEPEPEPKSTIISADPVLSADTPGLPEPEVAWGAPPPSQVEVPGAPGLVFAGVATRFVAYLVDSILIGIPAAIIAGLLAPPAATSLDQSFTSDPLTVVIYAALSLVYFVGLWMSGRKATLGMRMMKLQVGSAFAGNTLTIGQAATRWALLGYPLGLLTAIPAISGLAGLVQLVWVLILLVSTAASPTKQGIHDRFANSAVVQPAGAGTSGAATACLVIAIILAGLALLSIVALIFLSGQIEQILSEVGNSI